jgi:nitrite reductase/ring-hydroxylating ferredoxin subunit
MTRAAGYERVCDEGELWDGEMAAFNVAGEEVLLVRLDGCYRAYQGACPHQSVRLAEGALEGATLTCRGHLWQFDARSGRGINPIASRLACYAVKIEAGSVWVRSVPERDKEGS